MAEESTLTWIGTATVLLRVGGFTILTDPNFLHRGERAYVGFGLSTRRLTEPALPVDGLPPLDLVVLSHHHGDHFDRRAADGLDKDLPVVTEPHAARKLASQGFRRTIALQTWEAKRFERGDTAVTVTSVPARHAPAPLDRVVPPVMGSILDVEVGGRRRHRLYLTGDTLLDGRLVEIRRRFPDIDVCVLHLGATRIAGVLLTMDASQGVAAMNLVRPKTAVPVHHGDYTLFTEPVAEFERLMETSGSGVTVVHLERGQTHPLSVGDGSVSSA